MQVLCNVSVSVRVCYSEHYEQIYVHIALSIVLRRKAKKIITFRFYFFLNQLIG